MLVVNVNISRCAPAFADTQQRRRGLLKTESRSCSFPTERRKFPSEEIMHTGKFYFAPKFLQNGRLLASHFVFLLEKKIHFPTG